MPTTSNSVRPSIFGGVTAINQWFNMWDVNQIRNLHPSILFSYTILTFLKVHPSAKSVMIQMGKTRLYPGIRGLPGLD
jgi:hypothetical protein